MAVFTPCFMIWHEPLLILTRTSDAYLCLHFRHKFICPYFCFMLCAAVVLIVLRKFSFQSLTFGIYRVFRFFRHQVLGYSQKIGKPSAIFINTTIDQICFGVCLYFLFEIKIKETFCRHTGIEVALHSSTAIHATALAQNYSTVSHFLTYVVEYGLNLIIKSFEFLRSRIREVHKRFGHLLEFFLIHRLNTLEFALRFIVQITQLSVHIYCRRFHAAAQEVIAPVFSFKFKHYPFTEQAGSLLYHAPPVLSLEVASMTELTAIDCLRQFFERSGKFRLHI